MNNKTRIIEFGFIVISGLALTLAINLAVCGYRFWAAFCAGAVPALIVAAARSGRD